MAGEGRDGVVQGGGVSKTRREGGKADQGNDWLWALYATWGGGAMGQDGIKRLQVSVRVYVRGGRKRGGC